MLQFLAEVFANGVNMMEKIPVTNCLKACPEQCHFPQEEAFIKTKAFHDQFSLKVVSLDCCNRYEILKG
jgi:hypothetical protein